MLNKTGCHRFNLLLPLRATWKMSKHNLQKPKSNLSSNEFKALKDVDRFIKQANYFHPTIKFPAEISENQISFLDTTVFKGERFTRDSILDIKTHYKPTENF